MCVLGVGGCERERERERGRRERERERERERGGGEKIRTYVLLFML